MTEEKRKITCPKCGVENNNGDMFCSECGTSLNIEKEIPKSKKICCNKWQEPIRYPWIVELIFFSILTGGVGYEIAKGFTNFLSPKYSYSDIDNANTIWQQTYYVASNSEAYVKELIGAFIIVCIVFGGLLLVLSIWNIFKFNQIEKRIIETQEMIDKRC